MFGICAVKVDKAVVMCIAAMTTLVFICPTFIGIGADGVERWTKANDYQANSADKWETSQCQIESKGEIIEQCAARGKNGCNDYTYQCKLRVKMNEYANDDGSLKVLTARKFAVWTAPNLVPHLYRRFNTKKKAKKFRKKYVKDEWYVCYYKGGDENGPKRLAMKVGGKPYEGKMEASLILMWVGIGLWAFPVVMLILYCIGHALHEVEEAHLHEHHTLRQRKSYHEVIHIVHARHSDIARRVHRAVSLRTLSVEEPEFNVTPVKEWLPEIFVTKLKNAETALEAKSAIEELRACVETASASDVLLHEELKLPNLNAIVSEIKELKGISKMSWDVICRSSYLELCHVIMRKVAEAPGSKDEPSNGTLSLTLGDL